MQQAITRPSPEQLRTIPGLISKTTASSLQVGDLVVSMESLKGNAAQLEHFEFDKDIPFGTFATHYSRLTGEYPQGGIVTDLFSRESARNESIKNFTVSRRTESVLANVTLFTMRGEGDSYSLMSLFDYDSLVDPGAFDSRTLLPITRQQGYEYLAWKVENANYRLTSAAQTDDPSRKLWACVDARKQYRLAEIAHAVKDAPNLLEAISKIQVSKNFPDTGYYVLVPNSAHAIAKKGLTLVHVIDSNPKKLSEHKMAGFLLTTMGNPYRLSGEEKKSSMPVNIRVFAIPEHALPLLNGLKAVQVTRTPPTEEVVMFPKAPQLDNAALPKLLPE